VFNTSKRYILLFLLFICFCDTNYHKLKTYTTEKEYKRIVAADIFSADVLWQLGEKAREKVVGVPAVIDDEEYSTSLGRWPKSIGRIHKAGEEILVLNPDLTIIANFHNLDLQSLMKKMKIDYVKLERFTGFEAYHKNVMLIARAVNLEKEGLKIVENFNKKLNSLNEKAKSIPRKKTVLSYLYGSTMGKNSTFHDSVLAAGLINLSAEKEIYQHHHISIEQLQIWQPDYIVIGCGQISCQKAENNFPEKIGISNLKSKVIAIPTNILISVDEKMLLISETLQNRVLNKK